jgi:hypothetical protein
MVEKQFLRKLIKQGNGGLTVCLPKNWINENKLQPGDELMFNSQRSSFIVTIPNNIKSNNKSKITLHLENTDPTFLRVQLANAYRAGFDCIECHCDESLFQDLTDICSNYLLGFETFRESPSILKIETVFTPNTQDFEKFILKFFIILEKILTEFLDKDISKYIIEIDKYSNFFKRMISMNNLSFQNNFQFWSFLTELRHVSRMCGQSQKFLQMNTNVKIPHELKDDILEIFLLLKDSYFKKKTYNLKKISIIEREILQELSPEMYTLYSPQLISHMMIIYRLLYMSSSSLIGILQKIE